MKPPTLVHPARLADDTHYSVGGSQVIYL